MSTPCRLSATAYSVDSQLLSIRKLRLQSDLFPSGFQPKIHLVLLSPFRTTCPTHLIPLFTIVVIFIVNRYDVPNNRSKFQTQRRCQHLAPNIQAGGPPSVSCPPLIFKYARSYVTYVEATTSFRHLRMRQAVVTAWGSQPHRRVQYYRYRFTNRCFSQYLIQVGICCGKSVATATCWV